ncbi:hypothetical protein BC629DRAFT_1066146 [Irpex lacteus]|nr:hypothetical protein BC629DRAFT_1066146 [Irpex lacteus]
MNTLQAGLGFTSLAICPHLHNRADVFQVFGGVYRWVSKMPHTLAQRFLNLPPHSAAHSTYAILNPQNMKNSAVFILRGHCIFRLRVCQRFVHRTTAPRNHTFHGLVKTSLVSGRVCSHKYRILWQRLHAL